MAKRGRFLSAVGSWAQALLPGSPATVRPLPDHSGRGIHVQAGASSRRIANTYGAGFLFAAMQGGLPGSDIFNPVFVPDPELHLLRLDPHVGLGLEIWKAPLYGVSWSFKGGDPQYRAFLEAAFLPIMPQVLEVNLRALEFGRQTSEIVWKKKDVRAEWTEPVKGDVPKDPTYKDKVWEQAWTIEPLRDLDPLSTRLLTDDMGELTGVAAFGASSPLSPEKVLHVVHQQEFGSLYGWPLTQRCYRPWKYKALASLDLIRYLSQKGNPPLIATAPGDPVSDEDAANRTAEDPLEIAMMGLLNIRGGGVYVMPHEVDPESKTLRYDVKCLETGRRAQEFIPGIELFEAQCFTGLLVPPSITGDSKAYGASKVAERVFYTSLNRVKFRVITDPINEQIIPKLIRANFPDVKDYEIPRLVGGEISENQKEMLAEVLKSAIALSTGNPKGGGGIVQIASLFDWEWVLDELGAKKSEPSNRPKLPDPMDFPGTRGTLPQTGAAAPGSKGQGTGPTGATAPGRPKNMAPESGKPYAPSRRPGFAARREVIELSDSSGDGSASEDDSSRDAAEQADETVRAHQWWKAALALLAEMDDRMVGVKRISDHARGGLEQNIRQIMTGEFAIAAKHVGADGAPDLSRDLGLADRIEAKVKAAADEAMQKELLSIHQVDAQVLREAGRVFPASEASRLAPLAAQHAGAFHDAARGADEMGFAPPAGVDAKRVFQQVAKDAKRNAKGVVMRESRHAAETAHRIAATGKTAPAEAMKRAGEYSVADGPFARATEDHVRATARATVAAAGEEGGAPKFIVGLGPNAEREIVQHAPMGKVAEIAWKPYTVPELDAMYAKHNDGRETWSSWRDLGINFGSEEMYLPVPTDPFEASAVESMAAARRAAFDASRQDRQMRIDESKSAR